VVSAGRDRSVVLIVALLSNGNGILRPPSDDDAHAHRQPVTVGTRRGHSVVIVHVLRAVAHKVTIVVRGKANKGQLPGADDDVCVALKLADRAAQGQCEAQ
jgi:hypothetical protein